MQALMAVTQIDFIAAKLQALMTNNAAKNKITCVQLLAQVSAPLHFCCVQIPVVTALAMEWKVADFTEEIKHLEALEKKGRRNVLEKMYASLQDKLKLVHFTPSMVTALMDSVDESTLPDERKDSLLNCLDEMCGPQSNVRMTVAPQSMESVAMYLSSNDWSQIQKAKVLRDVMSILAQRLKAIGMVSMKEQCKKQGVAILLDWMANQGQPIPEGWPLYYIVKDFLAVFSSTSGGKCAVASLEKYPWNPTCMGPDWLAKVYGPNDKPACRDLSVAMYMEKIPLRSTSKWLKKLEKVATQSPAGSSSLAVSVPPHAPQVPLYASKFEEMFHGFMQKYQQPACSINILKPTAGHSQEAQAQPQQNASASFAPEKPAPLALQDKPGPLETRPQQSAEVSDSPAEQTGGKLKEFENKAFEALLGKSGKKPMKKPAAAKPKAKVAEPKVVKPVKKAVEKKKGWAPPSGNYGCLRCRGNVNGCDTCWNPLFQGQRFSSRQEWKAFVKANKCKNKTK